MQKKPTKKVPPKPAKKQAARTTAPAITTTVATPPTTSQVAKPRPVARYRRASMTAAQRRGADLVRFLRIHSKKPFARRGEEAIRKLAIEVGHLANIELGAVASVRES